MSNTSLRTLRVGFFMMAVASTLLIERTLAQSSPDTQTSKPKLRLGVDANYSLDMESNAAQWRFQNEPVDLFKMMAARGVTDFRVRLWTKEEGVNGKRYATNVVKRALDAGLNPYLVIFLSEDWADLMKQPLPEAWKSLSFDERKAAVEAYSFDVVTHFRKEGLSNHLYEIGNEIDYGICGEYPGKSSKKSPLALQRRLWPRSAELIKASQAGVLRADPEAKFMLHISHWWDTEFCIAFFQFMKDQGVQLDVAGLSYFPSSNIGGSRDMEELGQCVTSLAKAIDRRVILAETAYPSTRDFRGQFSRWKYEVMGYPMTEAGQQRWIEDLLVFCDAHPDIEGVYYWSPEWYGEGMWKGFALFDPSGDSKPAWNAFAEDRLKQRVPKESVFFELSGDSLFPIPVEEAKSKLTASVKELLSKTGGVNVEHIRMLEQTQLFVDDYSVNLKASLQKNLSLMLSNLEQAAPESEADETATERLRVALESLDAQRQRVVLVTRDGDTPSLQNVAEIIQAKGFEFDVHFIKQDQPIVFGMSDTRF